ncbi:MAG: ARMT1-like domain-containing protein [Methanothrix sp.]|uniref:damage-control phosphatase ARMT1 family protein n=1 Tax=Methanothrix sp. TaxID=90426 RepID=UPI002C9D048E|nr:ARMT1-like domain-containing protein [Methanothrix sp.]HRU75583.1 ARMT1-like domain-containing protein [Methanothrix sp.]
MALLRVASNCYPCLLDRAKFECDMLFTRDEDKKAAVEELLDFMAGNKGGVPALMGTEREFIIKRRSGKADPYRELKEESNRVARGLLPQAEEFYEQSPDKIEALIRIASAANSMEFGVKGHDFDNATFGRAFAGTLRESLQADMDELKRRLQSFDKIFYLTDNCGEVIFDLFVIERLEEMGKRVVVGSKSEPIINDVTAQELKSFSEVDVIPTGNVVGTALEHLSEEASLLLNDSEWLILSKGMGNFETMTEFDQRLKGRLIYILRAKCEPVAAKLAVPRGSLVARAV